MRVIHTSDLHLGRKFSGLGGKKGNKRRDDIRNALKKIVKLTVEKKADAFLIVGDLFETPMPDEATISFVNTTLSELGSIPAIIVPGTHDFCDDESVYLKNKFPENVRVITSFEFEKIELPNLVVYAAAYDRDNKGKRILRELKIPKSSKPVIVAVHGSYTYGIEWSDNPEEGGHYPITPEDRDNLKNVDYLALGHFHGFREIKSTPYMCYPGSPEGLSFKKSELDKRHVAIVEIDKTVKIEKSEPINSKECEVLELDCTTFENLDNVIGKVDAKTDTNKLFRLELRGLPPPELKTKVDSLMDIYEDKFFHFEIIDRLQSRELPKLSDKTVKGLFAKKLKEKLEETKKQDERKVLELARCYGLAALEDKL